MRWLDAINVGMEVLNSIESTGVIQRNQVTDAISLGGKALVYADMIMNQDLSELNKMMIILGRAFGPTGIKHFSELSIPEQNSWLLKVPVLRKNHDDWPKPLDKTPRTLTCYIPAEIPLIMGGNTNDGKPIPDRGNWFYTDGCVYSTSAEGLYIRGFFRYDDVDNYIEFPSFKIALEP